MSRAGPRERAQWAVGVAGIAFVGLFLISTFFGASDLGGPDESAEAIARDLSENRMDGLRVAAGLIGLSAIAGYWFVGGLHRRLAPRSSSAAPWVVLGAGIAMVTMVLATSAFAQATIVVDSLDRDPQVAKTLWLMEHGSWALVGPPQTAFILGVCAITINGGGLARWYGYSGIAVAIALVATPPASYDGNTRRPAQLAVRPWGLDLGTQETVPAVEHPR